MPVAWMPLDPGPSHGIAVSHFVHARRIKELEVAEGVIRRNS